jgi:hypothetical protein
MKRILTSHVFFLLFLVFISLLVRLYKLNTPLADWHSWRQADTVSVSREYAKQGYSFLLPHYHDLSDIPNGLNNKEGYRMVEFPVVNWSVAQVMLKYPQSDIVVVSRLFSIVFSLVTVVSLYILVFLISKQKTVSFLSGLVFGLLPYSVFYSRTALPEPAFVMSQVVALTFFTAWVQAIKQKKFIGQRLVYGLGATIFFAFALLFKPMAVFILPVCAVIAFYELGLKTFLQIELYFFISSFLPLLWWRRWIAHYPSGIPASDWLFNGNGIRLKPAWWRWLFADRIARLISGYWGVIFLFLGMVSKSAKKHFSLFDVVTLTWLFGVVSYLVVIATGNVQHDYYQVMLTPIIAILFARGVVAAFRLAPDFAHPLIIYPATVLVLCLTAYFSWYEVSGYYNINNPAIVEAGQAINKVTPADAKVIAPYSGDTAFLFQTNRTGWPIGGRIEEKIKLGATYYVTTAEDDEAKQLEQKYQVIEKTPHYIIIKLTPAK